LCHVLQRSIGPDAVNNTVADRQRMGVPGSHGNSGAVDSPVSRSPQHALVRINAEHQTSVGDGCVHSDQIRTGTAPDIKRHLSRTEIEMVENEFFVTRASLGCGNQCHVLNRIWPGDAFPHSHSQSQVSAEVLVTCSHG
jgi:hypothetical protein